MISRYKLVFIAFGVVQSSVYANQSSNNNSYSYSSCSQKNEFNGDDSTQIGMNDSHSDGIPASRVPSLQDIGGYNHIDNDNNNNVELSDIDQFTIKKMLQTPHLYQKMTESICPSVFGHLEIKRGVLLMLLGGVHKCTKEKINLRGDLNVSNVMCTYCQTLSVM